MSIDLFVQVIVMGFWDFFIRVDFSTAFSKPKLCRFCFSGLLSAEFCVLDSLKSGELFVQTIKPF